MAYRPQFAYPPPEPGFVEEEFCYFFDSTNVPDLASPLPPGGQVLRIPLQLEPDAPFFLRGIQISGNQGPLGIRFTDPWGNELAEGSIEADRGYYATLDGPNPVGRLPVIVEPQVLCPAGSMLLIDLTSLA